MPKTCYKNKKKMCKQTNIEGKYTIIKQHGLIFNEDNPIVVCQWSEPSFWDVLHQFSKDIFQKSYFVLLMLWKHGSYSLRT